MICSCSQQEYKTSLRPQGVPKDAFQITSDAGNYWYNILSVHDHRNNAIISIYDGKLGKEIVTKRFTVICRLEGNPIWIEDLKSQIAHFDGEKIFLKRPEGKDLCWLQ